MPFCAMAQTFGSSSYRLTRRRACYRGIDARAHAKRGSNFAPAMEGKHHRECQPAYLHSRARAEGPSCASNVSALARAAPSRIKKQSRKRWSLNEIVCHHCIKHRSDEWLPDKPMIHSARPNRLTPGAQDVGSQDGETASFRRETIRSSNAAFLTLLNLALAGSDRVI